MKTFLFIIVTLFIAVVATLYAIKNPGYVLLARAPWSVEMPLTLFVPIIVLAYGLFYASIRLISRLWKIPQDVARWRQDKKTKKARLALHQAIISLAEGNWIKSEAQLLAGLHNSEVPVLHYLAAACASQGQDNIEKRDEYLSLAHKSAPEHNFAIGMTQAHLQYQAKQYEQALATLSGLRKLEPDHSKVLKLLMQVYHDLYDWTSLAELIPELRRQNVIPSAEIGLLEFQTHRELMTLSLPSGSRAVLLKAWNAVPSSLRNHPELVAIYARHLIAQNDMIEAEKILRQAINREWNDLLVDLYGRAIGSDPGEQLEVAEGWLNTQPQNPTLLLTLGRLSLQNKIWGKARDYLEKSVTIRSTSKTCYELGRLLEQMGETENALNYYRRGIEIETGAQVTQGVLERAVLKQSAVH